MAAFSRRTRPDGGNLGRYPVRRRRAAGHLGSLEPHRPRARRIARLVDGRALEQKHFPLYSHTMLVVGPEHARTFADGGWSKDDLKRHLHETVRRPYRALLPDSDHGEGTNLRYKSETRREQDAMIPKFASTEEIHVVVAGGTAGRFSVAIPGWLGTRNGSRPVTRAVE